MSSIINDDIKLMESHWRILLDFNPWLRIKSSLQELQNRPTPEEPKEGNSYDSYKAGYAAAAKGYPRWADAQHWQEQIADLKSQIATLKSEQGNNSAGGENLMIS